MTPSGVPNSSINSICGLPKNLFKFFSSSFDSVSILRSMVLQEEIKKINKDITWLKKEIQEIQTKVREIDEMMKKLSQKDS